MSRRTATPSPFTMASPAPVTTRSTKKAVILLAMAIVLVASSAQSTDPQAKNSKKVQIMEESRAHVQIRREQPPQPSTDNGNDKPAAVAQEDVSVLPGGVIVRNILFEMDHPVTPAVWVKEEEVLSSSQEQARISKQDKRAEDKKTPITEKNVKETKGTSEENVESGRQDPFIQKDSSALDKDMTQQSDSSKSDPFTNPAMSVNSNEPKVLGIMGDEKEGIQSKGREGQTQSENDVVMQLATALLLNQPESDDNDPSSAIYSLQEELKSPMARHRLEALVEELGPSLAASMLPTQEHEEADNKNKIKEPMEANQDTRPDSSIDLSTDIPVSDKVEADASELEPVRDYEDNTVNRVKEESEESPVSNPLNKNHADLDKSSLQAPYIVPDKTNLDSNPSEEEALDDTNENDQKSKGRVLSHHHHRISVHRDPDALELFDKSKKGQKARSKNQQQQGAESNMETEIEDDRVLEEDLPSSSSKNSIIPESIRTRGLTSKIQGAHHCTPQFCVNVTITEDGRFATFHIERELAKTGWVALGIGYAMTLADLIIFWPIPESAQDKSNGGSRGAILSRRTAHAYVEPVLVGHSSGSNDLEDRPEENSLYAEGEYVLHNQNAFTNPMAETSSMQAFSSESDQKKFIVQFTRPITVQNRAFRLTPGKEQDFCWAYSPTPIALDSVLDPGAHIAQHLSVGSFAMDVGANQPGLGPVLEQLRQQEALQVQKDQEAKKKQIEELNRKLQAENEELQSEKIEDAGQSEKTVVGLGKGLLKGASNGAVANQARKGMLGWSHEQTGIWSALLGFQGMSCLFAVLSMLWFFR